jgi:hypothetical protein
MFPTRASSDGEGHAGSVLAGDWRSPGGEPYGSILGGVQTLLIFSVLVLIISQSGPAVLKNLSFHVKSGERVGIGKSSPSWVCVIAGAHFIF